MSCAIVTGGGTGIGQAISTRLAKAGFNIALVGRRAEPLEHQKKLIMALGRKASVITADVADPAAAAGIISSAQATFGRIDALVNCAGYAGTGGVAECGVEEFQKIMAVNLHSAYYLTHALWPVLAAQHKAAPVGDHRTDTGGVIVNISSWAARDPFPLLGMYAVAKAGINMLTTVTARDGAAIGVRAFAVAPAGVETGMFRTLLKPEQVPSSAILEPDDVAQVVEHCIAGCLHFSSGETIYLQRGAGR
jgi:3-oxoacyl-[acyl-carrier protein] reductase